MSKDNFYEILEVEETASIEEIKKSYRKLSLKYHPDRTNGDVEKVKVFQKINEAYETIGDVEKRQEYDMCRKNPFMRMDSMNNMGGDGMNMNDILSSLFFGGGIPGMGQNVHGIHGIHMGGMMNGMPPGANIRVFRNGVPVNINQISKPEPIVKTLQITMETVLNGDKVPLEIERWIVESGNKVFENTVVYVDIFKGIDHNEIIMLPDQGHVLNDTCKGDIKVFINIINNSGFIRKGLDLIINKEITLKESLCGFSFELKYINKKTYTINNQVGNIIPPNYQKIIPNMGLTRDDHIGNLIIIFQVNFPETLSLENTEGISKFL